MAVAVTFGAFESSFTVVVCVLVVAPSDAPVSNGVHFNVVGFMLLVSCIAVVVGVFNGVAVPGNTDIVSFDVVAVSCLEVSNAILFEVVVFGSIAEVVKCVMVVCCLELAVGKIVVSEVVIVAGTAEV